MLNSQKMFRVWILIIPYSFHILLILFIISHHFSICPRPREIQLSVNDMLSGRSVPRSTGRRPAACRGPAQQPKLHCCAAGATEASPAPPAASQRRSTVAPTREFSRHPVQSTLSCVSCKFPTVALQDCKLESQMLEYVQAPLMAYRILFLNICLELECAFMFASSIILS